MKRKTRTGNELVSDRIKTGSRLDGHSDNQYGLVPHDDVATTQLLAKMESLRRYGLNVYVCASLQLRSASRISEILQIEASDIDQLGRIIIRGSKKSNDKVLDTGEFKEWFLKFRKAGVRPFEGINRQFVYRCYVNAGISYEINGLLTKKVTHALRYEGAKILSPTGTELEAKQQLMGHKSRTNTKNYDKKKLS